MARRKRSLELNWEDSRAARKKALTRVSMFGTSLQFLGAELRRDRQIVLEAVRSNGLALRYVPPSVMDQPVVLEAVRSNGRALKYALHSFRCDHSIVLEAVTQWAWAIRYAHPSMLHDRAIVLALLHGGVPLPMLPLSIRSDRSIVLEAVSCDPLNFEFAGGFTADRQVVEEAVLREPRMILHCALSLLSDLNFIRGLVVRQPLLLYYSLVRRALPDSLFGDRGFAKEILIQRPSPVMFEFFSESLTDDKPLMLEAVKRRGYCLEFASTRLKRDFELIRAAVGSNPRSYRLIASPLDLHPELVLCTARSHALHTRCLVWWGFLWAVHIMTPTLETHWTALQFLYSVRLTALLRVDEGTAGMLKRHILDFLAGSIIYNETCEGLWSSHAAQYRKDLSQFPSLGSLRAELKGSSVLRSKKRRRSLTF